MLLGAQITGTIYACTPDVGKAKDAAKSLKRLFELQLRNDTWSTEGQLVDSVQGTVEFCDVYFRYSSRQESVLKGLTSTVKPGQYVALVGASGCGKSTATSLIERFYDPASGAICMDGVDIASLNVNQYRSFFALANQEMALYLRTSKG